MSTIKKKFAIARIKRRIEYGLKLCGHPKQGAKWRRIVADLNRRLNKLKEERHANQ